MSLFPSEMVDQIANELNVSIDLVKRWRVVPERYLAEVARLSGLSTHDLNPARAHFVSPMLPLELPRRRAEGGGG